MKHESRLEFVVLQVFDVLDQRRSQSVKVVVAMAILSWYYNATQCICWVDLSDKTSLKLVGIGKGNIVCFYVFSSRQQLGLSLNQVVKPFLIWFGKAQAKT